MFNIDSISNKIILENHITQTETPKGSLDYCPGIRDAR
jgi:hypothetical protein